ncbi:F-box protein At2g26160-like [Chenopodium quinoa]|uniref:F-box domain-containing protein n=1 Tax=Chenopodium quinoa TaxID=63459 RepID=A0A803MKQ7_CHEQI|nr:F-box protein At2g26160-like [Chenopodium quinoa]
MSSQNSSSEMPDWALMAEDMLLLILSHLLLSDIISFGCVCSSWYSVSKRKLKLLNITPKMSFSRRAPMLLIPTDDSNENSRNLYSLPKGEFYDLKLSVPVNSRCIGSSYGWLIYIDSLSFVITLYNPFYFGFNKGTIKLPAGKINDRKKAIIQRDFYTDLYISKAVLSADPSSCADFIVMVIHNERKSLAYYKAGDATWTYVHDHPNGSTFYDIMYYLGRYFVALNYRGEAYICNVNSNSRICQVMTEAVVGPLAESTRRYIVELDDGFTILQAVRMVQTLTNPDGMPFVDTICFLIYQLANHSDWIMIKNIGDGALFLGDDSSFYVKAADFPEVTPNSIYFTDDYPDGSTMNRRLYQYRGHEDSGIYVMRKKSSLYNYMPSPEPEDLPPPLPVWIHPTI